MSIRYRIFHWPFNEKITFALILLTLKNDEIEIFNENAWKNGFIIIMLKARKTDADMNIAKNHDKGALAPQCSKFVYIIFS